MPAVEALSKTPTLMRPAVREQWDNNHESKLAVRTSHVTAMFLHVGFSSQTEALGKAAFFGKTKEKSSRCTLQIRQYFFVTAS